MKTSLMMFLASIMICGISNATKRGKSHRGFTPTPEQSAPVQDQQSLYVGINCMTHQNYIQYIT